MARRRLSPGATEVDAYVFIKENLRALGWDARNPERVASGQVWTQNECLHNPEIKRLFGLDKPENIVKVTERVLWVIEAKRSHGELEQAVKEAEDYARKLNPSNQFKALLISGVAGNELDTFIIRTKYLRGSRYVPVKMNGVEVTGLLSPANCQTILDTNSPNLDNPPINEKFFIAKAEHINSILHLGAVNPHQRASVMSALLLSMLSSTGPNIEERSPAVLIEDINGRVRSVLRSQGKQEFEAYVSIDLPAAADNHFKFRKALVDTIQELNILNIRSAMNSGADWLGAFYEVFLKYASWAQDLGIVLTPRHITQFIADIMDIRTNDLVYDPTCGTGGFLVAAFDSVKRSATASQLGDFKKFSVFGIEQDSGVAALAVVNMIFRGDGKNNIHEGNCFAKFLKRHTVNGRQTAKYVTAQQDDPPITKVMMNPPFSLKQSSEKEFKFVEQALVQMQHGGVLFSVLPYGVMVKPSVYKTWRRDTLLANNSLLCVLTFPGDLFYPIGTHTLGIFVKKGIPHPPEQKVLWVRAINDGLLKSKGKRLPHANARNDLNVIRPLIKAFLADPSHPVPGIERFQKACPIDTNDIMLELVPEAYLDEVAPSEDEVRRGMEKVIRDTMGFLISEGDS